MADDKPEFPNKRLLLMAEFDEFKQTLLRRGYQYEDIMDVGTATFKRPKGRQQTRTADELRDVWLMVEIEKAKRIGKGYSGHQLSTKAIIATLYKGMRIDDEAKVETACRIYDDAVKLIKDLAGDATPANLIDAQTLLGWKQLLDRELRQRGLPLDTTGSARAGGAAEEQGSPRPRNPMPWVAPRKIKEV